MGVMAFVKEAIFKEGVMYEFSIKGITLSLEDMTAISDHYKTVCTAEYIAENHPEFANPQVALLLGHQVRQLMDKTELNETEAIDEVLRRKQTADFDPNDYTIEYCSCCESEVAIRAKGITACPSCGKPLVPCSVCINERDNGCCGLGSDCPCGCNGTDDADKLPITAPPMTPEEIVFAFAHC